MVRTFGYRLQRTCYSLLPVFLVGTMGLSGFTPTTTTKPSSDFFAQTFDNVRVSLAGNDVEKTQVKIGIAREYIAEIDDDGASIDQVQQKVNEAVTAVGDIEDRVRTGRLQVETPVLTSLLQEANDVLVLHQDKLRRIQERTSQDVLRAKLKTAIDRSSALTRLLKSDQEDVKDDSKLNGSVATAMLVTLEGEVTRDGSILELDDNGATFHLVGLPSTVADTQKAVRTRVTGVVDKDNENQLIVTAKDPKTIEKAEDTSVVREVSGIIRKFGNAYILVKDGGGQGYLLNTSDAVSINQFVDKLVLIKGKTVADVISITSQESISLLDRSVNPFRAGTDLRIGAP